MQEPEATDAKGTRRDELLAPHDYDLTSSSAAIIQPLDFLEVPSDLGQGTFFIQAHSPPFALSASSRSGDRI